MKEMISITSSYLVRAEIWLFATILLYFLMNGAQIFETLVFVPKWSVSPPHHFNMLVDGNGANLKFFWIVLHSLHEIVFILAIIFCWKIDPVRNWLLILFTIHFAVRIWTLVYFAPNIISFQNIAGLESATADLLDRTKTWRSLNYLRVSLFIAVSFGLIPVCIKLLHTKVV